MEENLSPCCNCSKNKFCDERGLYEDCEELAAWNAGDYMPEASDITNNGEDDDEPNVDIGGPENVMQTEGGGLAKLTAKDKKYAETVLPKKKICKTPNCDREVWAKGLCGTCYSRERKRELKEEKEEKIKGKKKPLMKDTLCNVEGCNKMARAKGLCIKHYNEAVGIDKLHVTFPKDSNMLSVIRKIAEIEFRTMNAQVIFFISRGIDKWVADNKERAKAIMSLKKERTNGRRED